MNEYVRLSAQMIKILKIKNEKQYNRLLKYYKLLSSESLKARFQTRSFRRVIKKLRKQVA